MRRCHVAESREHHDHADPGESPSEQLIGQQQERAIDRATREAGLEK
jgi:hypothetical protein